MSLQSLNGIQQEHLTIGHATLSGTTNNFVLISLAAVLLFIIISPKHWWELTLASPIPPIP